MIKQLLLSVLLGVWGTYAVTLPLVGFHWRTFFFILVFSVAACFFAVLGWKVGGRK